MIKGIGSNFKNRLKRRPKITRTAIFTVTRSHMMKGAFSKKTAPARKVKTPSLPTQGTKGQETLPM